MTHDNDNLPVHDTVCTWTAELVSLLDYNPGTNDGTTVRTITDNPVPPADVHFETADERYAWLAQNHTKIIGWVNVEADTPEEQQEVEANARLLAAAPDLEKALRRLICCLSEDEDDYPDAGAFRAVQDRVAQAEAVLKRVL